MSKRNENRDGYWKSDAGWIPDNWGCLALNSIASDLDAGVSVNSYDEPAQENDLGVLKTSSVSNGYFCPWENKKIKKNEVARAKVFPMAGSIIISRMNTKTLVGANAFVAADYPTLRLPDRLWQFRVIDNETFNPRWVGYLMASPRMRSILSNRATGTSGSMKNITKSSVLTIKVQNPPFPEQKKIAEILSAWDRAIDQTQKLIAVKKHLKKGLTQQLLTGRLRFPEFGSHDDRVQAHFYDYPSAWNHARISEVAHEVTTRNSDSADFPVLSCSKYDGMVNSLEYFGKKVYSDDTANYKVIKKGQFGFPSNHVEEGSIGLLNHVKAGVVSPIYTVFGVNTKLVYAEYLYALFKTETYRHVFSVNTNASVDRRGSLRWEGFSKIRIPLPDLEEQHRISDALNCCDREIEFLIDKEEALSRQKKGLMQKLLTGEVRVKIPEDLAS